MPVPEGAGRMRIATGAPLCRPMPLHSTAERIVCSGVKNETRLGGVNGLEYGLPRKSVCGKKATLRGGRSPGTKSWNETAGLR